MEKIWYNRYVKKAKTMVGEEMPKFFIKTNQIEENKITITGEDVKHITQVLRAKIGEELVICNIEENLNYITNITQITSDFVICNVINKIKSLAESKIDITLFQGLPKADKMEYIIQKNIELGVKHIVPVAMKRCIAKLEGKDIYKKIERWQKISESAAKQSRRDLIPTIETPINILKICEQVSKFDLIILAYEKEENNTLKNELNKNKAFQGMKVGIIVGPEGGIEEKEVEILTKSGVKVVTLGKRILRTETASMAMISNIIYEYEI